VVLLSQRREELARELDAFNAGMEQILRLQLAKREQQANRIGTSDTQQSATASQPEQSHADDGSSDANSAASAGVQPVAAALQPDSSAASQGVRLVQQQRHCAEHTSMSATSGLQATIAAIDRLLGDVGSQDAAPASH